eukprot:4650774-Lingulodinium_polyedra.AAC.1
MACSRGISRVGCKVLCPGFAAVVLHQSRCLVFSVRPIVMLSRQRLRLQFVRRFPVLRRCALES